ncbi:MAG TPA: hypothetical protein VFI31_08150 [Pirellulales bacterium]|nr:hypothetical protein [Pirellulales bacterium]
MKSFLSYAVCAAVLSFTSFLHADESTPKAGKKAKKALVSAAFTLPEGIKLSAEQQAKFDELKASYATKLADAQKKVADVYTEEQRAAKTAAAKEAKAAGKKGKELKAASDAAVQLTDEQKETLATAQAELQALTKEIRKGIIGLMTNEQRKVVKSKNKKQA